MVFFLSPHHDINYNINNKVSKDSTKLSRTFGKSDKAESMKSSSPIPKNDKVREDFQEKSGGGKMENSEYFINNSKTSYNKLINLFVKRDSVLLGNDKKSPNSNPQKKNNQIINEHFKTTNMRVSNPKSYKNKLNNSVTLNFDHNQSPIGMLNNSVMVKKSSMPRNSYYISKNEKNNSNSERSNTATIPKTVLSYRTKGFLN